MFKRIDIQMNAPICDCKELNIQWGVFLENGLPGLHLTCSSCKVILKIPPSRFKANYVFDIPYPGKSKEDLGKPKLKLIDGGKVLDFKTDDKLTNK